MFSKRILGLAIVLFLTACGTQESQPATNSNAQTNPDCVQGGTIIYGQTIHGYVRTGVTDLWCFVGTQRDSIGITMQDRSNSDYPSSMIPMITLKDQNGNLVATGNYDPEIPASFINPATLPISATYTIEATAKNPGAYDLMLWLIQKAPTTSTPSCPIHTISVDSSLSEAVVEGKVLGTDPCDATIEIHNTRSYWVNLKVIPLGGSKADPVGGDTNLYAKFGILGPDASVHYSVSFPKVGRSIQVQVDATFGDNAKLMNFVQLIADGLSITQHESGQLLSLTIDDVPPLLDAFGSMNHLRNAAIAFFNGNQMKAKQEMIAAEKGGEFEVLGTTFERLGMEGGKEAFSQIFKRAGKALGVTEIIWRNAKAYYQFFLSGKSAAGSVMFIAQ